jgi:hypothetical protein
LPERALTLSQEAVLLALGARRTRVGPTAGSGGEILRKLPVPRHFEDGAFDPGMSDGVLFGAWTGGDSGRSDT